MKYESMTYRRILSLFTLIIAGEVIFFLPFLIPRIFRPTLLSVFEITNMELGGFFSVYGVVAMISYVFGGQLADRYPARILMAFALWLTASGGIAFAFVRDPVWLTVIYGFWGFTTIFLFWAALIRATREWGGVAYQGRAFGWLEGGRGFVAALLGTISWLLFAGLSNNLSIDQSVQPSLHPFQTVILAVSLATILVGVLALFGVPDNKDKLERESHRIVLKKILKLIKLPTIWILAVMIICAYSGYKITDDFSLYAREVMGFSEVDAAAFGVSALWLRGIVAVLVGILADRFNKIRMIRILFALVFLGGLISGFGFLEWSVFLIFLNMIMLAIGIYGIRALYFAVLKEAGIPLALTGTAVGMISFLGYTPDVYMSPWMGYLLDNNPGEAGHRYVFLVLASFALLGFIASSIFKRLARD